MWPEFEQLSNHLAIFISMLHTFADGMKKCCERKNAHTHSHNKYSVWRIGKERGNEIVRALLKFCELWAITPTHQINWTPCKSCYITLWMGFQCMCVYVLYEFSHMSLVFVMTVSVDLLYLSVHMQQYFFSVPIKCFYTWFVVFLFFLFLFLFFLFNWKLFNTIHSNGM